MISAYDPLHFSHPGCRPLTLCHCHRGHIVVVVGVACGAPLSSSIKVVAVIVTVVTAIAAFIIAIVASARVAIISDDAIPSSPASKSSTAPHRTCTAPSLPASELSLTLSHMHATPSLPASKLSLASRHLHCTIIAHIQIIINTRSHTRLGWRCCYHNSYPYCHRCWFAERLVKGEAISGAQWEERRSLHLVKVGVDVYPDSNLWLRSLKCTLHTQVIIEVWQGCAHWQAGLSLPMGLGPNNHNCLGFGEVWSVAEAGRAGLCMAYNFVQGIALTGDALL